MRCLLFSAPQACFLDIFSALMVTSVADSVQSTKSRTPEDLLFYLLLHMSPGE